VKGNKLVKITGGKVLKMSTGMSSEAKFENRYKK
jgi:hypothetical protein